MSKNLDTLRAAVSANDASTEILRGIDKLMDQLGFSLARTENRAWLANAMRNDPSTAILKLDGLAAALRACRQLTGEIDETDLDHVADHRALRQVLLGRGLALPTHKTAIYLSAAEQMLIDRLKSAWKEGFHEGLQRCRHQTAPTRRRFSKN